MQPGIEEGTCGTQLRNLRTRTKGTETCCLFAVMGRQDPEVGLKPCGTKLSPRRFPVRERMPPRSPVISNLANTEGLQGCAGRFLAVRLGWGVGGPSVPIAVWLRPPQPVHPLQGPRLSC
jgi:hypothetical protein